MNWNTRVGTTLLVVTMFFAFPSLAHAQRGGGGLMDIIRKLSGPKLYGVSVTVYEVCIPGVLGKKLTDCPNNIRDKRKAVIDKLIGTIGDFLVETDDLPFPSLEEAQQEEQADSNFDRTNAEYQEIELENIRAKLAPFFRELPALPVRRDTYVRLLQALVARDSAFSVTAIEKRFAETWTNDRVVFITLLEFTERALDLQDLDAEGGRKPSYLRRQLAKISETSELTIRATRSLKDWNDKDDTDKENPLACAQKILRGTLKPDECRLSTEDERESSDDNKGKSDDGFSDDLNRVLQPYLRINAGWSTGSAERQGGSDDVNRFRVSPTLVFELESIAFVTLYGETGVSFSNFYGTGFDSFSRTSWDALGLGVRLGRPKDAVFVDVGMKFQYFFTPFTSQDFGGPAEPVPDGGEWAWTVVSIGVGFHLSKIAELIR